MLAHLLDEHIGEGRHKIGSKAPWVQDELLLQFALCNAQQCTCGHSTHNARDTLAQTIEAAELLTWKNIGSGHRGGPARGSPASERPAALRNGWGLGGRGPEPSRSRCVRSAWTRGRGGTSSGRGLLELKVPELARELRSEVFELDLDSLPGFP